VEAYLAELRDTEIHGEDQSVWKVGTRELEVVVCTSSAALVAKRFGGKVMGFWADDNPTAGVNRICSGHDFAVVGDLVVDYWLREVEEVSPKAVFDLSDPKEAQEAQAWYGPQEKWSETPFPY